MQHNEDHGMIHAMPLTVARAMTLERLAEKRARNHWRSLGLRIIDKTTVPRIFRWHKNRAVFAHGSRITIWGPLKPERLLLSGSLRVFPKKRWSI